MVLFNINTQKKGQLVFELPLYIISLVLLGLMLFFMSSGVGASNKVLEESAPIIEYQFPISFVQGFLLREVDESSRAQFEESGLASLASATYIKDILQYEDYDVIEDYIKIQKSEYIGEQHEAIVSFERFSGLDIREDELLIIQEGTGNLVENDCFLTKGHVFYLPVQKTDPFSELRVVMFEASQGTTCAQSVNRKVGWDSSSRWGP